MSLAGVPVGTVTADGPYDVSDAFTASVNFWTNWSLDPGQSLVAESNLRWLQLAEFSKPMGGFPNRPFIDPRGGQPLGGTVGDALPWYDISGPTKSELSLTGAGDDSWSGDGPFVDWSLAPVTFSVDTLVVMISDLAAKEARVLGGFHWGYSATTAGGNKLTVIGPTEVGDTQAIRDAFNAGLAVDFPGWTLVVPEPSAYALAIAGAALIVVVARGRIRAPRERG